MKGAVNKGGLPNDTGTLRNQVVAFMDYLSGIPKHVISYFMHPCVQYAAPIEI